MMLKFGTRILAFGLVIVAVFAATSDSIRHEFASLASEVASEARSANTSIAIPNPAPFVDFNANDFLIYNEELLSNPVNYVMIEDHNLENTQETLTDLRAALETTIFQEQVSTWGPLAANTSEIMTRDDVAEAAPEVFVESQSTPQPAPQPAPPAVSQPDPQQRRVVYTNQTYDTIILPPPSQVRPPQRIDVSAEARSANARPAGAEISVPAPAPRRQPPPPPVQRQTPRQTPTPTPTPRRQNLALETVWSSAMMLKLQREAYAEAIERRRVADSRPPRYRSGNRSKGMCRQAVSETLRDLGITNSLIRTGRSAAASLTGGWLERQRTRSGKPAFKNILAQVSNNPKRAPIGSILVYRGGRYGHVEIKSGVERYCSDYCSNRPVSDSLPRTLIGVYVPTPEGKK